ncbi:MoaD/ThiS family protein [Litoribacter ruber]|uniref:MoaD/ThiS family protein n=1 Tax=Litoribacter ruber TaxID=702568 RepID=A0AAP2G1X1_9BACT|nr:MULTISPECIES: MoaD/ThiS family protein [Litoribacter]MBS9525289.1 MoaD/ThiS family protein [Litoribacter alkaliphilus]MBT0810130.1 MoaD/ThiS family protein [Litoribacter ruber]
MEIILNNTPKSLPQYEQISAAELVSVTFPNNGKGIALAIENQVIPRNKWTETIIRDSAKVVVFKATQGG